jgi:hypothetical protein
MRRWLDWTVDDRFSIRHINVWIIYWHRLIRIIKVTCERRPCWRLNRYCRSWLFPSSWRSRRIQLTCYCLSIVKHLLMFRIFILFFLGYLILRLTVYSQKLRFTIKQIRPPIALLFGKNSLLRFEAFLFLHDQLVFSRYSTFTEVFVCWSILCGLCNI